MAGLTGVTHLSTLITGLQWAVDHQAPYGIQVLNLSLGYQSSQSTVTNPLDQAVQAVWNAGITVVASAGNAGPFNGTILSPGDDPMVITVGALDDMATPSTADDEMTDFSSVGPTSARRLGQAGPGHVGPVRGQPGRTRLDHRHPVPLGPGRRGQLRRARAPRSAPRSPAGRRRWCWRTIRV